MREPLQGFGFRMACPSTRSEMSGRTPARAISDLADLRRSWITQAGIFGSLASSLSLRPAIEVLVLTAGEHIGITGKTVARSTDTGRTRCSGSSGFRVR
jgi:hypothetical protein